MAAFHFSPLEHGQIRLLELSPGVGAEPLNGELHIVNLESVNAENGTSFEALSYVWGSNSKPYRLVTSTGSISLTVSLYKFLARLRLEHKSRLLWADAACICQDDLREKERQVHFMSTIFSTASCVLVDLGDASADTELALRLMDGYWRKHIPSGGPERQWGRDITEAEMALFLGFSPNEIQPPPDNEELPEQYDEKWDLVTNFFSKEWFSRVWVIQEFVLARDVIFYCGHHIIDWRIVFATTVLYGDYPTGALFLRQDSQETPKLLIFAFMGFLRRLRMLKQSPTGATFLDSVKTGRLWKQFSECHLSDLLHYFRHSAATLERDRYFALLKISFDFSDDDYPDLKPDYMSSTNEVILRFGRFLIQRPNGEEMFLRSGLWTMQDLHIPTWMQDFARSKNTIVDITTEESTYKASGNTGFEVTFRPDSTDTISLKGYMVDEILKISSFQAPADPDDLVWEYIQEGCKAFIHPDSTVTSRYGGEVDVARATYLTICAYRGRCKLGEKKLFIGYLLSAIYAHLPKESRSWVETGRLALSTELSQVDVFTSMTGEEFQEAVVAFLMETIIPAMQGLRPAITKGGYLANLPSVTEPGDQIWAIQGIRIPVALRKSQERRDTFRLVGSGYCHGLMDGEALQLPDFSFSDVEIY